jgi:hypothetical protein
MAMILSPMDQKAISNTDLELYIDGERTETVLFQFPPKVVSDSKSGKWEVTFKWSYEPVAVWKGSEPREIKLDARYIVHNVGGWGAKQIQNQILAIKSHFYQWTSGRAGSKAPYMKLYIYKIAPYGSTWRLINLDITYSEELVYSDGMFWPLESKVSMSCALFTGGAPIKNQKDAYVAIKGLPKIPKPEWY